MLSTDILSSAGLSFVDLVLTPRAEYAAFARRLSGSRDTADEVVQIALIRAMRAWPRFDCNPDADVERAVRGWMFFIIRNEYFRFYSKGKRRESVIKESVGAQAIEGMRYGCSCAGPGGSKVGLPIYGGMSDQVLEAISLLPKHHRDVIVLTYLFDFTVAEVAESIGVCRKTTETRLTRARAALRKVLATYALGEYGYTGESRRAGETPLETAEDLQADAHGVEGVVAGDDKGTLERGEPAADHATAW